jgi:Putative MetA-pathway of phenol degradation
MSRQSRVWLLAGLLACLATAAVAADGCPTSKDPIGTDRPDSTNTSVVVPTGSFQSENGIDLIGRGGATILDGTNSRLRVGVARCLEVFVDVPTYFAVLGGEASSGATDVAPGIKWQISPLPGRIDLSAVVGAGLPTGTPSVAGRGVEPYVQFPASFELGGGWAINTQFTAFFYPSDPVKLITEPTVELEKELGEQAYVFVEYIGDYPEHGSPVQMLNTGGAYRLTRTEQIDFHVAAGLNTNAPDYIFGLGYSFRVDGLF